jgi:hypothetical protein
MDTSPILASQAGYLIGVAARAPSLALPGWPHMLLEFGICRTVHLTARRPTAELIGP